jgi:glycosyltransferase involved in cell wall biosynthesis
MQQNKISVVCPTYNSASFIVQAIKSVQQQEVLPAELIVSDDGSNDGTVEIVESLIGSCSGLNLRLIRNIHLGPGAARNAGIKAAVSEWVAFLDADDLWLPGKITAVLDVIRDNPECNFICHNEQHILENGTCINVDYGAKYSPNKTLVSQLFYNNLFSTSAVVCLRKMLIDCGGFDEGLMSGQDYELWMRMSPNIRVHFIRFVYGCYVIHQGNITSGNLEKRIKNNLIIRNRYRRQVGVWLYVWTMSRVLLSYVKVKFLTIIGP